MIQFLPSASLSCASSGFALQEYDDPENKQVEPFLFLFFYDQMLVWSCQILEVDVLDEVGDGLKFLLGSSQIVPEVSPG